LIQTQTQKHPKSVGFSDDVPAKKGPLFGSLNPGVLENDDFAGRRAPAGVGGDG